jgi:hypothetical protein
MARTFGKREFMESVSTLDPSAANIRIWARDNKDLLEEAGWKFEDHHRDPKLYSPEGFYVDVIRNAGGPDRGWQWLEERSVSTVSTRDPRLRSREQRQDMYGTWGYGPRRDAVPRGTMGDMLSGRSPVRGAPAPGTREAARPSSVRETPWSPPGPERVEEVIMAGTIPPSRNYGTLRDNLEGVKRMGRQAQTLERDMDPRRYRYPVYRRRY